MKISVCVVLLCMCLFGTSESCRCGIIGEDAKFCNAKFGVIVKVFSESTVGDERRYEVAIMRRFKGDIRRGIRTIFTTTIPSMCGATLDIRSNYLLAGTFRGRQMHLSVCKVVRKLNWKETFTYQPPTCA